MFGLIIVVPAGFAAKYYAGPGEWFLNNWGSSLFYELFFIFAAFLIWPYREYTVRIAVTVCLVTILLEFGQLWNPPWLLVARSTFVGKALLGTTFSWADLPAYPAGCLAGWWITDRLICRS